jgi:hypothetical protein
MTNPRTRIVDSRSLPAPPQPAGTVVTLGETRAEPVREAADLEVIARDMAELRPAKLIGKPHGNMRCVGLYLPRSADVALRTGASASGTTFGETLMEAIYKRPTTEVGARVGGRRHRRQQVPDGTTVFVLVTNQEAATLADLSSSQTTSVSAIATQALLAPPE